MGAFGVNGAARMEDIRDGVSKTILIGEAVRQKDSFPAPFDSEATLLGFTPPQGGGFWGAGTYQSVTAQVYPIDAAESAYSMEPNAQALYQPRYADIDATHFVINYKGREGKNSPPGVFSSRHRGGANFVFADGSAHFISDKIDQRILYRYATVDAGIWPAKGGGTKKEQVEPPGD
jgi:prepilin-type processing-associated H-X9-DG protein